MIYGEEKAMNFFAGRIVSLIPTLCVLSAFVLSACDPVGTPEKISLRSAKPASSNPPAAPGSGPDSEKKLRVAIAAMISPKETYVSYKDLMTYIGEKSGMAVELVQRETYQEINDLLEKDLLDAAFVCTGAYIEGRADFGMEILAVPVTQGRTVYYSYTIVAKDSPIDSFEKLRGKSFAFTDPLSNTGKLSPTFRLARMGETPATFFKSTTYTYSHDKSIEGVARKVVDGAAVDSLIWDYMNRKNPEFTSKTKIIGKSDPYGIPPVVVSRAVSPELKAKLLELFLHAHEDPRGREILSGIMIEKFVVADDGIYDSVRAMRKWVDENAPQ
jgi:phosphonate transport system substrate-binding protein